MYIPKHFREEDMVRIYSFLQAYNFGILMTSVNDAMTGTHLPFLSTLAAGKLHLTTHLAAANDQMEHLKANSGCMVIFNGPHAYVSPSLYEEKRNVPTWNFIAVHAYGRHRVIADFDEKKEILERSIHYFEAEYMEQWESLDHKYRDGLIHGMTGLEITVDRVEAKYKLSQNKPEGSRKNVADHFSSEGHGLGEFMKE